MGQRIIAAVARTAQAPLELEDLTLDDPRDDEVVVELAAAGICHSDLLAIGRYLQLPLPMVYGHEGAGVVVRAGKSSGLSEGDHVVLSYASCRACANCNAGHPAYCDNWALLNYGSRRADGSAKMWDWLGRSVGGGFFGQSSFASHALIARAGVARVPQAVPLTMLGGFGCGFISGAGTIMNVLRPEPGSVIAILGAGAVGFAALFAARLARCGEIVMVDRVADRLALALELGASKVINTNGVDIDAAFEALGAPGYVVDTTGAPEIAGPAIARLAKRGICALVGVGANTNLVVDVKRMLPGRTVTGVVEGDSDPQSFIPVLVSHFTDGAFPVDRLIRHYEFKNINEAIREASSAAVIKPVLTFGDRSSKPSKRRRDV